MFAYCLNSPLYYADYQGASPKRAVSLKCWDRPGTKYEETLGEYIKKIAKPVTKTLDQHLEHTNSTGFVLSGSSGGVTLGGNLCVSNDNYGNFALQASTSVGYTSSFGYGASIGVFQCITNAKDVQDLYGPSESYGITVCWITGFSVDLIVFEPNPGDIKWGLSFAVVTGAEFEIHAANSMTDTTGSWHLSELFQ